MDNNKDGGMITNIWGPPFWKSLFFVAFGYPLNPTIDDKNNYLNYFIFVGKVLPCHYCRDSYNKIITNGITNLDMHKMKNRESLTQWLYLVRNAVNYELKVDYNISYEDVKNIYNKYYADCDESDKLEIKKPEIEIKGCSAESHKKCMFKEIECVKNYKFISNDIASRLKPLAIKRGITEDECYILNSNNDNMDKVCQQRNKECDEIYNKIKTSEESSIESNGQFKGMPTINELKLIVRMSSTLDNNQLLQILKKYKHDGNSEHLYKLYKSK